MSYILYINQSEGITEIPLPAADNQHISADISRICPDCTLELEVLDGVWRLMATDRLSVRLGNEKGDSAVLSDGAVINLLPKDGGELALIVKEIRPEENSFAKYSIAGKGTVTIGRAKDNSIVISDEFVGSHHCIISTDGGCTLSDSSKNGTFINGVRVTESTRLNIFDEIYITGHKLIFLGDVIAVCKADCVKANLPEAELKSLVNTEICRTDLTFFRSPRRIEPLDDEAVQIDDPPAKQKARRQPLIFIIGPSVTMPIPILVSVLVNIAYNSGSGRSGFMYLGTAVSVVLSALIGTLWALAHRLYDKKQMAADEQERIEAYNAYIENNKKLLEEKHAKNRDILEKSYLSSAELSEALESRPELIWNRNMYQNDFLAIRIGRGKVKLPGGITVSGQRFSMNDDELCKYPRELHDKYEMMDDCISVVRLFEHKLIGMVGDKKMLPLIANNIVIQTAALHCYTDVKIGFIADSSDRNAYEWAKWLPHAFLRGKEAGLVSFGGSTGERVIYELAAELRRRSEISAENERREMLLPHLVIFCTSAELLRSSIIGRYLSSPEYLGVTFILVYGSINALPNECRAIIECSEDFSGFYLMDGTISDENKVIFDTVSLDAAEKFARKLSSFYVSETASGAIPSSVDYFDMIGIGKPEHWDLLRHYRISRSYEGIKALLGLGIGGEPVYLDLHEKKDGPHGLVAGMTGSGKSETLQTLILSVALNYSPDDAAFVLIDYKGGGMANAFEKLPHTAGMITNLTDESSGMLDSSLTRRACSSLRSEIRRRQTILSEYGLNHIDAYAVLYKNGEAAEPMPHLIIISDEFAELKREQPDFIKDLVSVACVGRSLGIHLILATQKPTGVVDDQIWSNSRFRICLKVQDKQDSAGMLKRPDAAYITEAGRAFLQIGNDEIFSEFQSGYSGGEYIPKERVLSAADSEAVMIEMDGSPSVIRRKRTARENAETELSAAVKYIGEQCEKHGFSAAKSLWLPPLERSILLDDIDTPAVSGQISVVYGKADNYKQQVQFPVCLDLSDGPNLKICGTAASEKTTLLQTLICSAVKKYSPELFNFYIIDFSSRTLKLFKGLPHCGGVVYEDEEDAVGRLMKLLTDIADERRKLFERSDIGSFKEYTRLNTLPLVLLVIDNFGAFSEQFEEYEEVLLRLMREGIRYGIKIAATVNNTSEMKYKMRSYMSGSIALRMAEKGDYNELLGRAPDFLPAAASGRGLMSAGGEIMEFQTALPAAGESEAERAANMKKLFGELSEKYGNAKRAKPIPIITENMTYTELIKSTEGADSLPIGYDCGSAEPYSVPFAGFYCYCISGHDDIGIARVFGNICEYATEKNVQLTAVRVGGTDIEVPEGCNTITDYDGVCELIKFLHSEFGKRNAAVPEFNENRRTGISRDSFMAEKFGRLFIIIDDMSRLCEMLYSDPAGSKCAELVNMFFAKGKDHGVHIFAGYNSSRKTYLAASNTFKSENHGIHLGGKAGDQNVLDIAMPVSQKLKQLPSNIGFAADGQRVSTVYVPEKE